MNKITALLIILFFFFIMTEAAQPVNVTGTIANTQTVSAKAEIGNTVWIGTNNGLYITNKITQKTRRLTTANSVLPSNKVTGIAVTADGNVYVATDKGVFRYDGFAYLVINAENSKLPATGITAIAADKNDNLWIATSNTGLILMNNYKCRIFNTANSLLTSNNVISITSDRAGNIIAQLNNRDVVKISDKMHPMSTAKNSENATASSK